jgi:AcrR family transcriptional regulator
MGRLLDAPTPTRMAAPVRREQLLDVTGEIVADQGFQAVSIQSVARRAGISRPLIYEHFGDLQGLLEALVEREMKRALEQVSATALGDLTEGDPPALMLESLRTFLEAVQEHPSTWRFVLMPPESAPELLRCSIIRGRNAALTRLARALRPISHSADGAPEPELSARILSAVADEYARLLLTDPSRFPPERLLTHARWLRQSSLTLGQPIGSRREPDLSPAPLSHRVGLKIGGTAELWSRSGDRWPNQKREGSPARGHGEGCGISAEACTPEATARSSAGDSSGAKFCAPAADARLVHRGRLEASRRSR